MSRGILLALVVVAGAAASTSLGAAQQPVNTPAPVLVANRIILRVADLGKSVAFYRDQIGLPLQNAFDDFAVLGRDGTTVMLQQVTRKSSGASTGLASLTEVVLESADIFASYQLMKSRGVVFRREPAPATTDGAKVLYTADFRDPDGHVLSIMGWVLQPNPRSE
jgi:catechol 2,3-dioxygenase-like lactoylglutathione lyase family enzyme